MKHLIGIIQMCASENRLENLNFIKEYLMKAKNSNVKMCFLPESFFMITSKKN